MSDESCEPIIDLLVDYCDGELEAEQADYVTTHLAACPDCCEQVQLLRRSLDVAKVLWSEAASAACRPEGLLRQRLARPVRVAACGVACASILLLVAGAWFLLGAGRLQQAAAPQAQDVVKRQVASNENVSSGASRRSITNQSPSDSVTDDVHAPSPIDDSPEGATEQDDQIDVETLIAREARSAKLAFAARLLAGQPGLERYRQQAERYLAKAYRGTAAAAEVTRPAATPTTKEPRS